jgi:hypothetical protein
LLIALTNLDVVVEVTDNSLMGNLIIVAVDTTIVAVRVFKKDNTLEIVAVDVVDAAMVLNNVKSRLIVAVVADDTDNDLRKFNTLEMVLVLVDVADNVGVRVIVSWSLIATLFTLDPFIAILTKLYFYRKLN